MTNHSFWLQQWSCTAFFFFLTVDSLIMLSHCIALTFLFYQYSVTISWCRQLRDQFWKKTHNEDWELSWQTAFILDLGNSKQSHLKVHLVEAMELWIISHDLHRQEWFGHVGLKLQMKIMWCDRKLQQDSKSFSKNRQVSAIWDEKKLKTSPWAAGNMEEHFCTVYRLSN